MALSKSIRIGAKEVALIFKKGQSLKNGPLLLRFLRTDQSRVGLAIIVPARVAPLATRRNSLRRRLAPIVVELAPHLRRGFLVALVVNQAQLPARTVLAGQVLTLFEKSGILET